MWYSVPNSNMWAMKRSLILLAWIAVTPVAEILLINACRQLEMSFITWQNNIIGCNIFKQNFTILFSIFTTLLILSFPVPTAFYTDVTADLPVKFSSMSAYELNVVMITLQHLLLLSRSPKFEHDGLPGDFCFKHEPFSLKLATRKDIFFLLGIFPWLLTPKCLRKNRIVWMMESAFLK